MPWIPFSAEMLPAIVRRGLNLTGDRTHNRTARGLPRCNVPKTGLFETTTVELAALTEVIASAAADGRFVVLALIHELGAASVVAEDFVVEIQTGDYGAKTAEDAIAGLRVDLEVRQSVGVARGAFGAEAAGVRAGDECW